VTRRIGGEASAIRRHGASDQTYRVVELDFDDRKETLMAKYLLVYHGGGMPDTPEEQAKVMEAWGAWMGGLGEALVDGGNPVGTARMIAADGSVSDGGGPNPVTGYSIISADSLDAAVQASMACPVLASGGSIQVAETFDVM
jgi:hypothetical protein